MNLSNILESKLPPRSVSIAAILTFTISLVMLISYCTAPNTADLPQADVYRQESANAHTNSVIHESEANVLREQVEVANRNRSEAQRTLAHSINAAKAANTSLTHRKTAYEKIRTETVIVSSSDLDARERILLSKLRSLYWEQR